MNNIDSDKLVSSNQHESSGEPLIGSKSRTDIAKELNAQHKSGGRVNSWGGSPAPAVTKAYRANYDAIFCK